MKVRANYYQQFDADLAMDVPAEGFGGWKQGDIDIAPQHTAVAVMHAWDCGTPQDYPGWHRVVEFFNRSTSICRDVFPPLLDAVRQSPLKLFHVVGGGGDCAYMHRYPGYHRAVELAGPEPPPPPQVASDPMLDQLRAFREQHVCPGTHNGPDIVRGFANNDFPAQARPRDDEGVANTTHQLLALCRDAQINHLIYVGFAINWCLLLSSGGMAEMNRHGVMCSTVRQAVTAVENRETARTELAKQIALWRVAVTFGFVFDLDELLEGLAHG